MIASLSDFVTTGQIRAWAGAIVLVISLAFALLCVHVAFLALSKPAPPTDEEES